MIEGRVVIIPFLEGRKNSQGRMIVPNMDAIMKRWLDRHPEHRNLESTFNTIKATTYLDDGTPTVLVRISAVVCDALAEYDYRQDIDLYREFLMSDPDERNPAPYKMWMEQCEAIPQIEFRTELPKFVAEIKNLFEPWRITEFFETPRRLGALGHASDESGHIDDFFHIGELLQVA